MNRVFQTLFGVAAALLSVALLLGSLAVAMTEDGAFLALQPSPTIATPIPTSLPTNPPPPTPLPGEPTFTPSPVPTLAPTATFAPPTTCPPPAGYAPVAVQPGDDLDSLAQQYNTSKEKIKQDNCLVGDKLIVGMLLYLPSLPPTAIPTATACGAPFGYVLYTVKSGDTLYHIAWLYSTTVADLQSKNCMGGRTLIRPGEKLWVPNVPTRTPPPTTAAPTTVPPTEAPTTAPPTPVTPSPVTPTPVTPTPVTPTPVTPTPETPTPETPTPETPTPDTPTPETPTPVTPTRVTPTEETPAPTEETPVATEEEPSPTEETPIPTEEPPTSEAHSFVSSTPRPPAAHP